MNIENVLKLKDITKNTNAKTEENSMKEADKKLLAKALGSVFVEMFNNKTNTVRLKIGFNKFIAEFEILLIDVKEKGE